MYPDFIPNTTKTEITSICSFDDGDYDEIEILLHTDVNVKLEDVELNTISENHKVDFLLLDDYKLDGNVYSILLDRKTLSFVKNTIQLVYKFDFDIIDETMINFNVYYLKENEIVEEFSSFDDYRFEPIFLTFYQPQHTAPGRALKLYENKVFDVNVESEKYKNLAVEFWGKFNDVSEFLKIVSEDSEILSLSVNKFKMLETNRIDNLEIIKSTFLAKQSWYHFCIYYNYDYSRFEIYVNDELNYRFNASLTSDLQIRFLNSESDLSIDLLRIWDLEKDLESVFENKNFKSISNFSKLIYLNNFDENTSENRRIDLVTSDAPLFSLAPELNIKSYSNFYILEWEGRENDNVKNYILEKSVTGKSFTDIYKVNDFSDDKNTFTYTDVKNPEDKLVYYRVKQINTDGSITYSSQLKIGQKKKKNFVLKPNFPNPFNPVTKITIELLEDTDVLVVVYNIVGIKVQKIYKGSLASGEHSFEFNGSEFPSGIYLLEVKTPVSSEVMKMILAK